MFEMNLPALQKDLADLQGLYRALNTQADQLQELCGRLPQSLSEPEAVRQLQRQQRDLVGEADQALQLCRALEQIVTLVAQTETRLAEQPDSMRLTLDFAPPGETRLSLESQTEGIRITW